MATTGNDNANDKDLLPMQYIRGCPFPGMKPFQKETIESALDFIPRDDDIIISTYPKTGTNWIKYIVWEILNKGAPLPTTFDLHFRFAPYMEMAGVDTAKNLPPPRILQYHVDYHLIPKNASAKYIYVVRNPKDTLVSCFHFMGESDGRKVRFNDFFECFLQGKIWFGDYFDHVLSWYAHRDDPNFLILFYEQMIADPRKELFKIAEFLGEKYFNMLKEDDDLTKTILERTSFNYMKKKLNVPESAKAPIGKDENVVIPNFLRKGIVGDWKNHLTPEQNERFEKLIAEKFKDCDISKFWSV